MLSSIAMGGAERNIVSVLPYLQRNGVNIDLVTLTTRWDSPLADEFVQTGIRRINMQARRMVDPDAWGRFVKLLRDGKYDVVHSQDQDSNIYNALAHLRHKQTTVMTRHVLEEASDSWKENVRARMLLVAARVGFDRVIAVSEATRQRFAVQTGLPLNKIETIYNGIHLEQFATRDQRDATRAQLGWKPEEKIIIMVAVLRRGKGHEILFDAVPALRQRCPSARIKLVGDGQLHEALSAAAQPYADVVEFMGQRMDVAQLLGAADVLVLPSWSEALPTVLIEAGAASLPAVATDVGGTSEIVEDGVTGWIVPPGDAVSLADRIAHVIEHPEESRHMGERAAERVNRLFSFDQQAARTVDLYERVLRERKPS